MKKMKILLNSDSSIKKIKNKNKDFIFISYDIIKKITTGTSNNPSIDYSNSISLMDLRISRILKRSDNICIDLSSNFDTLYHICNSIIDDDYNIGSNIDVELNIDNYNDLNMESKNGILYSNNFLNESNIQSSIKLN